MKRIIALLLILTVTAGCFGVCANAADTAFSDVSAQDYFYESVLWAVEQGITTGLDATHFGPAGECTRAQAVTFLWRAEGEPKPAAKENPFRDVSSDAYYYNAVLWAVEQGISNGLSADSFGPDASCTRGQIVTFLWRYGFCPEPESSENPFADASADAYYGKAMLWAVENAITNGMSETSFAPDATCTRGQIVTFLYRSRSVDPVCPDCEKNTAGMTFDTEGHHQMAKPLEELPLTFEAVFTITEDQLPEGKPTSKKQQPNHMTSLMSADNKFNPCAIYAIDRTGSPAVIVRNEDYATYEVYTFDKVNVATGKPVRMSIVLDFDNTAAHCYIDGALAQTITGLKTTKTFLQPQAPIIGGDLRNGNGTWFRGVLDSVTMWADIRTDDEIAADHTGTTPAKDRLLAAYDLTGCEKCRMKDLSGNGYDLNYIDLWMEKDEVEPVGEYDYSIAVVGDTQTLCRLYPEDMAGIYDWILENQESQKIEYVLGLGDITDGSKDFEWETASENIGKLNGKIPYLLARGNHDFWDDMNRFFHNGYYETTLDGMLESREVIIAQDSETGEIETVTGDITNAYQCATVGGTDYLFLTVDFAPTDAMLEWAGKVIEAHPDHRVIVLTHAYMYRDGTTISEGDAYCCTRYTTVSSNCFPLAYYENPYTVNNGDHMWEKVFSQYENVLMVLSGHDPWQHIVCRQDKGIHGNTVTQMLIDPQYVDLELAPSGMVAMFYFSNGGNTLTVRYYSVSRDCYGSPYSQFTIDLA